MSGIPAMMSNGSRKTDGLLRNERKLVIRPEFAPLSKSVNKDVKSGYTVSDLQRSIGIAPQTIRKLLGEALFLSEAWYSCETWPGLS